MSAPIAASEDLPPVLASIAEAAGEEIALLIARTYGGTRVIVPAAPGRNWLTAMVGEKRAALIIDKLGPTRRLDVPLGPEGGLAMSRRQSARAYEQLEADHAPTTRIARSLGITDRAVRMRRARKLARQSSVESSGQGDLFREHSGQTDKE